MAGWTNKWTSCNEWKYSFGKPSKITASTYNGRRGVINIEEIKQSGVYMIRSFNFKKWIFRLKIWKRKKPHL